MDLSKYYMYQCGYDNYVKVEQILGRDYRFMKRVEVRANDKSAKRIEHACASIRKDLARQIFVCRRYQIRGIHEYRAIKQCVETEYPDWTCTLIEDEKLTQNKVDKVVAGVEHCDQGCCFDRMRFIEKKVPCMYVVLITKKAADEPKKAAMLAGASEIDSSIHDYYQASHFDGNTIGVIFDFL